MKLGICGGVSLCLVWAVVAIAVATTGIPTQMERNRWASVEIVPINKIDGIEIAGGFEAYVELPPLNGENGGSSYKITAPSYVYEGKKSKNFPVWVLPGWKLSKITGGVDEGIFKVQIVQGTPDEPEVVPEPEPALESQPAATKSFEDLMPQSKEGWFDSALSSARRGISSNSQEFEGRFQSAMQTASLTGKCSGIT